MDILFKIYCRIYQWVLRCTSNVMPWRVPELLVGPDSIYLLPDKLKNRNIRKLLIITDKGLVQSGLVSILQDILVSDHFDVVLYDETVANPTVENVESALKLFLKTNCQAIIAIGGGSPIDCAKAVCARVAQPGKTLYQMRGILKVLWKTPDLIAIPTTAGTGSEVTLASVITDPDKFAKYAITDFPLIPQIAILDPKLTLGLPQFVTATTGMDALTHAVEAYIGQSNTDETRESARKAVRLIFENLIPAFEQGHEIDHRQNMQIAAYHAGLAFTRAYVGYVHAMAHSLGGRYGIPHGLANAVILPYVLEAYGSCIYTQLAELADEVSEEFKGKDIASKANYFIQSVKLLNERLNIPQKLKGILDADIEDLVNKTFYEANPFYPVPQIWNKAKIREIFYLLKG